MLPGSNANAERPQVPPGSVWITTTCSILFLFAYACVIFTAPDRLRESLIASPEPSVVSLGQLAADDSRDPRYVILQDVRVESVAEREAREDTLEGLYRIHPIGPAEAGLDDAIGEDLELFFCADDVLLPGCDEEAAKATNAGTKDLRHVDALSGVLRRPNPLAYRLGVLPPDCGISPDAWLLHLDRPPYRAGQTLAIIGSLITLAAMILTCLLSQNWIPNRGLSIEPLSALMSLVGWPLRRHRGRWPVQAAYLITGTTLISGGFWCVHSGDRAVVIDAYFLEYWLAGVGLVTLGLALVMRVAWVVCRPAAVAIRRVDEIESEPDDERPAQDRPLTKFVVSLRTVAGGVWVTLLVANIANNMAGQPVAMVASTAVSWAIATSLVVHGCSHWLLITMTRGFSEKSYEPLERTPRAVRTFRQRSEDVLESAGFERRGAYRLRGSAFHTNIELHLGCNGMVIAEFLSLSGNRAIELTSITDGGLCIVTASCDAPQGKPATRWSERFYSHCAGTSDFEKLLRTHLGATADLAEKNDATITVLDPDDVLDVLKYSSRAMHDMVFQQGESKDRVGPARYGRFRFPTGLAESREDSPVVEAPVIDAPEENLAPVTTGS